MRSKFKWIFTLLLALSMQFSFAQEKTVTGTVSDETGPLPGANVVVKGTKRGVQTDVDGKYAIKAKAGEVLLFSFIGLNDATATVGGSNVVNMVLKSAGGEVLGEVVVTGQGIKKEKKALGYAVTTIKAEEFASKPNTDVARALTGKAPGVNIQQTSGLSGSGTNIIIRGYSSITGSNQPLFVVDGIPFNSDTNSESFLVGATSASSRFLDLDPNNIETINILKGLSATTLYGSAGRNGVILVTTKSGNTKDLNKKMEVTLAQSLYFTRISNLPEYQNNYGNGFDNNFIPAFSNWGPNFNTRGEGGVALDGTVEHPYSFYGPGVFPQFAGARVPYTPKRSVENFFRTGYVNTTSVNIGGRSENTSYNLGVGHTNDEGFIERNGYDRLNISMGGTTKLNNGFTFSSTMNFTKTEKVSPLNAASFGSNPLFPAVFANILYTPRNIDLFDLPYSNPNDNSSVYYRKDIANPIWTLRNGGDDETVRRFFGNITASYEINSWSNISYRLALDNFTQKKRYFINKGNGQPFDNDGFLNTTFRQNTIFDHTFSYNFDTAIGKNNKFNLDGTLGLNPRQESVDVLRLSSTKQVVFGLQNHDNFVNQDSDFLPTFSSRQNFNIVGAYFSTTLGYNKYLYLNLQGRNDYFSSLQPANRSIFYPSASLSFVPTDAFEILKNNKYINYVKTRISYGTSAGFPPPYASVSVLSSESNVFLTNGNVTINTQSPSSQLGNLNLKPELITELEFGFEGKFFDNRVGIDFSAYNKVSTDLIIERPLEASSGYTVTFDNIAELYNRGVEIGLNLVPLKSERGLNWTSSINFTRNRNIVTSLGLGSIGQIRIEGFTNLGNFAMPGQPYGVIIGSSIARDGNGSYIVGSDGNYVRNTEDTIIGDPNPDWNGTWINEFSFRNISFQMQWEYQKGGDIYSTTAAALLSRGLTKDTDFDRSGTFVLPGVNQNGNINTTQIGVTQYGFNNSGFFISEQAIYDATNIRLREVSLSYNLPKKYLEKTPFGKMSISIVGNNMWFKAINFPKYLNFDTDVLSTGVGNGRGFDFLTGPTAKRFGFNFNLTF